LEAFRSYARSFPDDCILLVDTFDTLQSGVPNAIKIAKELEKDGHRLAGIRIDSGDLASLSKQARGMFDREGLEYVKIVASSELDEYLISDILSQGGRIDLWGVGTHLVAGTGDGGGALGGVYKMAEHNGQPKIKLSANPEKMTNPGAKKIVRFYNQEGLMEADAVAAVSEDLSTSEVLIVDPGNRLRRKQLNSNRRVELLRPIVQEGNLIYDFPSLDQIRDRRKDQLATLHESHKRLYNPHAYKVGITQKLWQQKQQMINDLGTGNQQ
jgi:nicotinate phosphoribosyltransferase